MERRTVGILFLVIVLVVAFGAVIYSQEHDHGKAQEQKKEHENMMGHLDKMMEQCHHMSNNMTKILMKEHPDAMGMMNMKNMMMGMQNMSKQMKDMMESMNSMMMDEEMMKNQEMKNNMEQMKEHMMKMMENMHGAMGNMQHVSQKIEEKKKEKIEK